MSTLDNRERFEIALNAVTFSNYCLTQSPAVMVRAGHEFVDKLIDRTYAGGLPLSAIAAARSLGIEPSADAIRKYIRGE